MHQGNIADCETLPLLVSFTACLTWKGLYIQRVETLAVPTFWAEVRGPGGNEAASRQGSLPTQQIGKLWFWHVEQMPAVILCLYNYLSSCWTWKIRAIQNGFVIFAPLCKVSFLIIERDPELSAVYQTSCSSHLPNFWTNQRTQDIHVGTYSPLETVVEGHITLKFVRTITVMVLSKKGVFTTLSRETQALSEDALAFHKGYSLQHGVSLW